MPSPRKPRETPLMTRWKIALLNAGVTQEEWSAAHGWTASHVSQTIGDKRPSRRVMECVAEFIATQEQLIAARVGAPIAPAA